MTTVTAGIDAAISRARRQIELLREYRTRLIADVVTGKLDVRETTANLPEESRSVRPLELDNNNDNATKCNRMQHCSKFSSGHAAIVACSAPPSTAPHQQGGGRPAGGRSLVGYNRE